MSNKPAPVEPDEDQDVIVHRMVQIEATTGLKQEIWTVWLEADKKDQYSTRVDAVRFRVSTSHEVSPTGMVGRRSRVRVAPETNMPVTPRN